MRIHASRFEQATALTDVLLGGLCVYIIFQLAGFAGYKADIWVWAFGCLAFSSFAAAITHGFEMTRKTNELLWMPVNLSLGLTMGLFVVGALFDLSGEAFARSALPFMLAIGFLFFLVTVWRPGSFLTFIIYEAAAMLFALGAYSYLFFTGSVSGAVWMAAGVFVTIIAAVVQVLGKAGRSIFWYFDNNSIFHFIQMLGIVLMLVGLKSSL